MEIIVQHGVWVTNSKEPLAHIPFRVWGWGLGCSKFHSIWIYTILVFWTFSLVPHAVKVIIVVLNFIAGMNAEVEYS